jgi:hypothetical protein
MNSAPDPVQFRRFSETLTHIGLECPACKRVLNVERTRLREDGAGLSVIPPPLLCPCGASGLSIAATAAPRAKNGLKEWLGLGVIVGLTLLLCFGLYSCEQASARDAALRTAAEQDARDAVIAQAIKKHQILVGMTCEQVIAAWGKPASSHRTITSDHVSEQYCYPGYRYAYFTDGILTSIQD